MMTNLEQQMIRALAAIDDALGIEQDGCNSTEATLDAIKLMQLMHRDDVAEIERLTARIAELEADAARIKQSG